MEKMPLTSERSTDEGVQCMIFVGFMAYQSADNYIVLARTHRLA